MMKKMTFALDKDEEGYPPDDFETLWVEKVGRDEYRIDNIPFYVRNLAPDDVVIGEKVGSILWYKSTVQKSDSSVFRIVFYERQKIDDVLRSLQRIGCKWEGSHLGSLYSIEAPGNVHVRDIKRFLTELSRDEVLDFEEGAIRQQ
jgi:hypothetical protein